ncbi:MAG: hypothetical protein J07AB43_12870 [Candidatus Nanosalina sp. J07AB43]|jgi:hypothetical protein|nr:MAG: hypothetical protein J07AB43_12870 [Candidatus Nanosalina sp. J07AB43]
MKKVCIVAMREETFNMFLEDQIYPVPAKYPRASKQFSYLAAYRKAPVSAITHIAQIKDQEITDNPRPNIDQLVKQDYSKVKLFHLEKPEKISKVGNDQSGVRGARYTNLSQIRQASSLSHIDYEG